MQATHNRSGEITFDQIDELTIRMTVTTYTKASSEAADRDSLLIFWGDGSSEYVHRSNAGGDLLPNDVQVNYYIADHVYPGRATYTIQFEDPNRVSNILNITPTNSVDIPFFLSTTFTFLDTQFQGINNSAKLLQPPIDIACIGQKFIHNPNAYDPDGDSLAYELIVPRESGGIPIDDYVLPNFIAPGPDNVISLNEVTGDFIWDAPKVAGEYNVAFLIKEYRNGVLINSIIRDMQILVKICTDRPPTIDVVDELCVIAGELIELDIVVDDLDQGQLVQLTASGGPLVLDTFNAVVLEDSIFQSVEFTGKFIWQTQCEHISDQYYQVVFRAVDNYFNDSTGLAELKTLRIKIIGPAPQNLEAESNSQSIRLTWDLPYACEETLGGFFQGFSIWRRQGSNPFFADSCETGLDGRGYEIIEYITLEHDGSDYFYVDGDVEKGQTYCYRVLAEFALLSPNGNPFNAVQSQPSNEICLQLIRDLPLITKVSVESTSPSDGEIFVRWTKPLAQDLDTIMNPPPYRYVLNRSNNGIDYNPIPGTEIIATSFSQEIDTTWRDMGLNTESVRYHYDIDFYASGNTMTHGDAPTASSVFLNIGEQDRSLMLTWEYETPWVNILNNVYRFDDVTSTFELLDQTTDEFYLDADLENGKTYCYKIETIGTYNIADIEDPIINFSQENCGIPHDLEPPCAPELEIFTVCENIDIIDSEDDIFNSLSWSNPNLTCTDVMDVASYNVYFALNEESPLEIVDEIDGAANNFSEHKPDIGIAGCYAVTAIDTVGNESDLSNIICIDNCPQYELPNTFTPNGDSANDFFKPITNLFIESIDLKVFNRWGNLVFETTDPVINWDGNSSGGKELSEGTYYYTCNVIERRVEGNVVRAGILKGYINLIRG